MTMIHFQKNKIRGNRGQVLLIFVILFLLLSMVFIFGVVKPTLRNITVTNDLLQSKRGLFLSNSAVTDAVYRINNNMSISSPNYLTIDNNTATTTIIDTLEGKTINSISNFSNYIRGIELRAVKGDGVSFFYAVQTGEGGFQLSGGSKVIGNVYSNGPISGGTITGSAVSAGATGTIQNTVVGTNGVGDAYANSVTGSTVAGSLFCKTGSSNNKVCDTVYTIPPALSMPISAAQITEWQNEAAAGQVISGDYSPAGDVSIGPVKITGDFTVKSNILMTGTIWVNGVLSFGGQGSIRLATSTYGSKSGVIIVDKTATFTGGSQIQSTGVPTSYVMLLVTSDCPTSSFCSNKPAINASGGSASVVLAAPNGTISFTGGSGTKEAIANQITTTGNVTITYETGVSALNFVSGPKGSFNIGSYREL